MKDISLSETKFIVHKILIIGGVGTFIKGIVPMIDQKELFTLKLEDFPSDKIILDDCFLCDCVSKLDGISFHINIKVISKLPNAKRLIRTNRLMRIIKDIDYSLFRC